MSISKITIRDWRQADLHRILDLNESNTPHVGPLSEPDLDLLLEQSCSCRVAEYQSTVAGFLVAFLPNADYASENFQWFKSRYPQFLYIDRIAVDETMRRQGIASHLYADAERIAESHHSDLITCEVNVRPRNDVSLKFHQQLGFQQVGIQDTKNGTITVSLLAKELTNENLG